MSQRRFWSFSVISALYILAFAHLTVPLSAQSGNDKPPTAESNPKEVRRKPTNLELGMPVAFPMFRPAALASAGPVTVTTESTTAEESEEHMEFVPLPSTVRGGSAPFASLVAQNPTEPVEQWSMGRVTRRPNELIETTTQRDKGAVHDPCLTPSASANKVSAASAAKWTCAVTYFATTLWKHAEFVMAIPSVNVPMAKLESAAGKR
ncbi:hypothetical protein Ddc_12170 [Ditylenchus destructor]|nr:hypothetical protein Ddc_12170 [Ditylenchus destructor]